MRGDLRELLAFVGRRHPLLGSGIRTRADHNDRLHAAMLELERLGAVRRCREDEPRIYWEATDDGRVAQAAGR
jgi:hypothetical protein